MIPVTCDGCGKAYRLDDSKAGRTGRCGACGAAIKVPAPQAPAAAEPAASGFAAAIERLTQEKAKKTGAVLGRWVGTETEVTRVFQCPDEWRLLWAANGRDISSFTINVRREGKMKTIAMPVNERNLAGIREGAAEIDHSGEVYLEIKTTGCERWYVIAQALS